MTKFAKLWGGAKKEGVVKFGTKPGFLHSWRVSITPLNLRLIKESQFRVMCPLARNDPHVIYINGDAVMFHPISISISRSKAWPFVMADESGSIDEASWCISIEIWAQLIHTKFWSTFPVTIYQICTTENFPVSLACSYQKKCWKIQ